MFVKVVENPEADKEAKPEAMYWCGDAYFRLESEDSLVQAYRMFKRLTWDFPATKWAKYARGRLAEPEFARVEQ
jgi:outer membrane protein assembly factor BamD (BamD/ComL family)